MFRYTPFLVGAVLWAFALSTPAATTVFFSDDFEPVPGTPLDTIGPQWNFDGVHHGPKNGAILTTNPPTSPPAATHFLGEFGGAPQGAQFPGDVVRLNLTLPSDTVSVRLDFDAYLLRTWDGQDVNFAGPDTFGYGYNNTTLMWKTFSNGEGNQSYCRFTDLTSCEPSFSSDPDQKNKLGFGVELTPPAGSTGPSKGTALSLVYHMSSTDPTGYGAAGPIAFAGGGPISFFFFSSGLQLADRPPVTDDESWGLDNVKVIITTTAVPEPKAWALMISGLALLLLVSLRRRT